jgi:hypothetical protein
VQVFDTDHRRCGAQEATSSVGGVSLNGAFLVCVKGRGVRMLHDSERGARPPAHGHGVGGMMGCDWLVSGRGLRVFWVAVMQERLLARSGEGARWFPCLPRDGVHGRDGKEESCWVS